ncbi:MAG: formylglycine-generating enzyme family protein [Beijerinckiaceae bacterium]
MPEGFGARLLDRGRLLLLFDGLDEVSDPKERTKVARWIEEAAQARPTCTAVVTCRFAGYDPETRLRSEFLELHLRPLTREQSEGFIRNWYRVVETGLAPDPAQGAITAQQRAEELIERLKEPGFRSARMVEMTRNPLLLANLCLVHRDRGGLPRGRHQLYDECIEVLLERWREAKALTVNVSAEIGRSILQPAALWLHAEEGRTRASAQVLAPVLEPALKATQWRDGDAQTFLRTVRDESGLLTGWGPDQYGFMHLGFQEYLAACELRRQAFEGEKDTVLKDLANHYGESWWQEVILLLLAQRNPSLFTPFMREAIRNPRFPEASELLGLILEESPEVPAEPFVAFLQEPPGTDQSHWAGQLTALGVLERLQAEDELSNLAESLRNHPLPALRNWVKSRARAVAQPVLVTQNGGVDLVLIPGGTFHMGSPASDAEGYKYERPAHDVQVPAFYLGRHPVTNEEYGQFLKANPDVEEPGYWGNRQFNQARQPVVGVSWEDARRFAQWAGARLPTEAEWEYAARAGTTTRYWWGDEVGKNNANCDGCGSQWDGKQSSPVGSFQPNAFGLHDMLGNVWEWVQDCWHESYEGAPLDGSAWEQQGGDCARRVVRGGSWGDDPSVVRSASRSGVAPGFLDFDLGFRLAQDI